MNGGKLCENCRCETADFFCSCSDPETVLCELCLGTHAFKSALRKHHILNISLLYHYKNPRFLTRLEAFPHVREGAINCIEQVDRAIEELTERVKELQAGLSVLCTEKVKELLEIKDCLTRDISIALEEVEKTLAEEEPLLLSQYGPLFRECTEKSAPLQLFTYSIETYPPQTLLCVNSRLPTAQELSFVPRLAGVFKNEAFIYEVKSQIITRHALTVNFGSGGSFVELDRNRLLCVGASPASSAVYTLDLTTFELSRVSSLSIPRCAAGVAKLNSQIHVFGGVDGTETGLRACAKLDLTDKRWTGIGNMAHPRAYFTPCHFRSLFYLITSWKCPPIETFCIETETFTVLSVSLPPQLAGASVAFIANEELCVLTEKKLMARWKVNTGGKFRVSYTDTVLWSNQQPLLVGSLALIVYCGCVWQFSLESYSFIKTVK